MRSRLRRGKCDACLETRSRATPLVGTRSRVIRVRTSAGHVGCTASDGRCTLARPGSHVWNASVDVLPRTRRNADTIRGGAPDVTIGRPGRGSRKERVPTIASASSDQIVKSTGLFAETLSVRPRSGSNTGLPCPTNDYFGQQCPECSEGSAVDL
jgi:hypothetical protein